MGEKGLMDETGRTETTGEDNIIEKWAQDMWKYCTAC